jgi:hypothetical protein
MAVRPVAFAPDGSVQAWHDEQAHGGVVPLTDLRWGRAGDGSVDLDAIEVPCPVGGCGGVSRHPIGGGVAPGAVQLLFVRTVLRRAAALGVPAGQRTFAAVKARVKARVEATDSPGRWRLDALQSEDDPLPDGG